MDALTTGMEVVVGERTMMTVIVVGAVRPRRLKLHHFGFFGVGEACIVWTTVYAQSIRVMLAWPKLIMFVPFVVV